MREGPSTRKDGANRTKGTGLGVNHEARAAPAACAGPLRPPGGESEGCVQSGWGSTWRCPWGCSDVLSPQGLCMLSAFHLYCCHQVSTCHPPSPPSDLCQLSPSHEALADQPHFLKSLPLTPIQLSSPEFWSPSMSEFLSLKRGSHSLAESAFTGGNEANIPGQSHRASALEHHGC